VADRDLEQDDPRLVAAARHALHDEELVAAFAVDGDAAEEPDRARMLIERCPTCRDLHADMVAIGATIRVAGTASAVGAVRQAPRDYRLTASDAVRLRGGNALERVMARLRDGVSSFGRPVGASLAALGVVGLLVGTMALAPLGSPAAMSTEGAGFGGDTRASTPAASVDLRGVDGPLSTAGGDGAAFGPLSTAREDGGKSAITRDDGRPGPALLVLLFAGSIALLVAGAALLVVASRRRSRSGRRAAART
jgi:hypothetical protein